MFCLMVLYCCYMALFGARRFLYGFEMYVKMSSVAFISLIILIGVLSKTCKKQQGKYEVEK